MTGLRLQLFGTMQARIAPGILLRFPTVKSAALLAYLAAERGPQPRERLATLLWPEQRDETAARAALRQELSRLRRLLGDENTDAGVDGGWLVVDAGAVQLNPAYPVDLDTAEFGALIADCEHHAHRKLPVCPACHARLLRANVLYSGPFLDRFDLDSAPYQEWASGRREALQRQALFAAAALADAHLRRGEYAAAITYAQRQLALDPWREPALRQSLAAMALAGERLNALAAYQRFSQQIKQALNAQPEPETRELAQRIEAGLPPPAAAGACRLPGELTPFVGREAELSQLLERMQRPDVRLVTLIGPGGIGKTRLALHAAAALAPCYDDGVCFVALAGLEEPQLLPATLAAALGQSLLNPTDPKTQLFDLLRPKELLLVLDNYENLPDGAEFVADLLRQAPRVSLIVTSRARLNLQTEHLLELVGLPVPPVDCLEPGDFAAVRLFTERAGHVRADFDNHAARSAIAEICRRVEGSPLAIELAAALLNEYPPEALAAELARGLDVLTAQVGDLPARHHSLRRVFEHSWRLLSPAEQEIYARLSVFRGGFSPEAALQVAGAGMKMLSGLAGKSLLRSAGGRHELHEALRPYAGEKLESLGLKERLQSRHLAYYAGLARRMHEEIRGPGQIPAIQQLTAAYANLRIALAFALESDVDAALQLGGDLGGFWRIRGDWHEARRCLESALALPGGAPGPRAWALAASGFIEHRLGDRTAAEEHLCAAESLARELDDKRTLVTALVVRLLQATDRSDAEAVHRLFAECTALFQTLGDSYGLAAIRNTLGYFHLCLGGYAEARRELEECIRLSEGTDLRVVATYNLYNTRLAQGEDPVALRPLAEETLALSRTMGNSRAMLLATINLGKGDLLAGNLPFARSSFEQAVAMARDMGDRRLLSISLEQLAVLKREIGEHEAARRLLLEALEGFRHVAHITMIADCLVRLAYVEHSAGADESALARLYESLELRREIGSHDIPVTLDLLMELRVAQGRFTQAARLHGAAARLRATRGAQPAPSRRDRERVEGAAAQARTALGASRFSALQAEGGALEGAAMFDAAFDESETAMPGESRSDKPRPGPRQD